MRRHCLPFITALALAYPALAPANPDDRVVIEVRRVVELKDGTEFTVDDKGHTYHVDAMGKRVDMRDGELMEAKDGAKYVHKNDVLWRQNTEKKAPPPNR